MKKEERISESKLSTNQQWLAASALVPVIGALSRPTHLQALIYTFFVFVYLSPLVFDDRDEEKELGKESGKLSSPPPPKTMLHVGRFCVACIAGGMASATLFWLSLLNQNQNLLVPYYGQLSADLFLAFFKYAALAATWLYFCRHSHYLLSQIFLIMFVATLANRAVAGDFAHLAQIGKGDLLLSVFTVVSWYAVDGAIVALAFISGGRPLLRSKEKSSLAKCAATTVVAFALPQVCTLCAIQLARLAGLSNGQF